MKNKFKPFLILAFSILFLSSCFELVEELKLNKDGSGEYQFTFNLSQSKTKLKSIMLLDKINGYKVPTKEEITNHVEEFCTLAKNTKGISNVKNTIDFDNFIFTMSCDFQSIETLNKVVKNFRLSKKLVNSSHDKQFEYDKKNKIFSRNFEAPLKQEFDLLKTEDRNVFKNASFVSIYKFEEEIKEIANKKSKISSNKKSTMLKVNIMDIINKKEEVQNKIKL